MKEDIVLSRCLKRFGESILRGENEKTYIEKMLK
jgi:hypothetical protein